MYLEVGELAEARDVIGKGLDIAATLYKSDTDADDPNKALKANWPSVAAYIGLLRVAAEIEPNWALQQLRELPDEELRTLALIAMARGLLGKPMGSVIVMNAKKKGTTMTTMRAE